MHCKFIYLLKMIEQTLKEKAESLGEHIGDILETKKELALINAAIVGTNIASTSLVFLLIILFGLIFLLFGAISLALWLGKILEDNALGFIATAFIFLAFEL